MMLHWSSPLLLLLLLCWALTAQASDDLKLQVITIATEETDGYKRFMRSSDMFNLNVKVVGMGVEWRGGDVARWPGGGQKVNLLRPVLEAWRESNDVVVMFVDSYDVIFTAGEAEILAKFRDFNSRVVFSAEPFCWPDSNLASQYPRVGLGKRFLCSGGFIGYAPEIYAMVSDRALGDEDDDQLYYTLIYLDQDKRDKLDIRLDHRAHIFQNLNGAKDEVELKFLDNSTYAQNIIYDTRAAVYHGNGGSKVYLNSLGNYIPAAWTKKDGCLTCLEHSRSLPEDRAQWPTVLLAVFVEQPTPFLPEMLERLIQLDYPRDKISLWVHNTAPYHEALLNAWFELVAGDYSSASYSVPEKGLDETAARRAAMRQCISQSCGFMFAVDSVAMLDHAHTLQRLIELNRDVIAPMLVRPYRMFSNFWGDVASNGFYARSHDYQLILEKERRGVWNVPFISAAILFKGEWLKSQSDDWPSQPSTEWDPDIAFSQWMRSKGHFLYVSNLHEYGHLVNADSYNTTHLHNDMYQIFDNKLDWERKYIHENWSRNLDDDVIPEQPCPDVYWYPLISETFARELVEEMEHFGEWSGGGNNDKRISGGYENVPTRDIHMKQVGFQEHWLELIQNYIVPVQIKVYPGYYSRGFADLNFVVKYWPEGQSSLRPHHDSSTFTTNIALSRPGIDHEGGGCRFLRYNCSVVDTEMGWTLMHPGRLTHYHEGLRTTKGTRYIMVSFIDP